MDIKREKTMPYLWKVHCDNNNVYVVNQFGKYLSFPNGKERSLNQYRLSTQHFLYDWGDMLVVDDVNLIFMYVRHDGGIYYKVTTYDCNLIMQECFLGEICKDFHKYKNSYPFFPPRPLFKNLLPICENAIYSICDRNILLEEGNEIRIYGNPDTSSEFSHITLRGIQSVERVKLVQGENTILYSFYIIKTEKASILLNLKSLKYKVVNFKSVFPFFYNALSNNISVDISPKKYSLATYKGEEYLCADNVIYDIYLQPIAVFYPWEYMRVPIVLDFHKGYFAYCLDGSNTIELARIEKIQNKITITHVDYCCRYVNKANEIGLYPVSHSNESNHIYFDPVKKIFLIDKEAIIREKNYSSSVFDDSEWAGLGVALDEEWGAYWGEFD